MGIQK
ncbi:putative membrane protein, partial [Escherichia coli 96.0932]